MITRLQLKSKLLALVFGLIFFSQFSVGQLGENILPNGGWEDEVWESVFRSGTAGDVTQDAANARTGSFAGKVKVTTPNGIQHVQAISDTMKNMEQGQYQLSAYLKADAPRIVKFNIFQSDSSSNTASSVKHPEHNVGTEYEKIRTFFTPKGAGFLNIVKVRCQLGAEEGINYIDDVAVQKIQDMINPGFEDADDYFFGWNFTQTNGAVADTSQETTDVNSGSSALKVEVTTANDTASHVTLKSDYDCFLDAVGENQFKFNAKAANVNDSIWSLIRCFDLDTAVGKYNFAYSIADSFALTTSYAEYSTSFTIADSIAYVQYSLHLGDQVTTYYLDDFSVVPYAQANITSTPVETGTIDELYEYQLTWDGTGTFSVSSLPEAAWLNIDQSGLLSGTPTAAGEFEVTVSLDDGTNPTSQLFTLVVSDSSSVVAANITSTAVEAGTDGELYEYQLTWEGTGTFSVSSSPEAAWLSIAQSGLLSGTPTAAGEFEVTVTLDDEVSPATQTFTIVVSEAEVTSVQEIANTNMGLYPNPATEIVNITNANGSVISILDITGKAVIAGINVDSDSFILEVDNLVSGMYIVAIKSNDAIITKKLYVE